MKRKREDNSIISIKKLLNDTGIENSTLLDGLKDFPNEANYTHEALLFLKKEKALTYRNSETLAQISPCYQLNVAKGIANLKRNSISTIENRAAITNRNGDFISTQLVNLYKAQLLNSVSRALIVKSCKYTSIDTSVLLILLHRAKLPNYLECVEKLLTKILSHQFLELIDSLLELKEAEILNPMCVDFLISFHPILNDGDLLRISRTLVSLNKNDILNNDIIDILKQVQASMIWEVGDMLLRMHHANCLSDENKFAMATALQTSIKKHGVQIVRTNLISFLTHPFFTHLENSNHQNYLCSLALALPFTSYGLLSFFEILEEQKLLNTTIFLLIIKIGFREAAAEPGYEEALRKIQRISTFKIKSEEELEAQLQTLFVPAKNEATQDNSPESLQAYRNAGLLFRPSSQSPAREEPPAQTNTDSPQQNPSLTSYMCTII